MAGNVIPLPSVRLHGLGVATTSGTGNRITGSRSEIWHCPAYDPNYNQVALYVKVGLSSRAILVEALASQLAQAVGLQTPEPYLVTVRPSHVGQAGTKSLIAFGSLDVSARSMARPVRSLDVLFRLLERLKISDLACAFDEWIANDVRSPSDILICPESRVYLIDHEAAMPPNTAPDAALTNWLAARLMTGLSEAERIAFLKRLRARVAAFHRVKMEPTPLSVGYLQDGGEVYHSLVKFLIERLQHLDQLLSQRVVPEQLYLKEVTPAAKDEAGKS
jgi:hypothetical protein